VWKIEIRGTKREVYSIKRIQGKPFAILWGSRVDAGTPRHWCRYSIQISSDNLGSYSSFDERRHSSSDVF
jgi:hypothetical protein